LLYRVQQPLKKAPRPNQATAPFTFYTAVAPSLPRLHANALSFSHGDRIEYGNLFGALPGGGAGGVSSANAPVVINEFLVKPPDGVSEFIEVFNTTGDPIDISGWKLIVTNGSFKSDFNFTDGTPTPHAAF